MKKFIIKDFTKYGELMTYLMNKVGMSEKVSINYLNQCYTLGKYDCGVVIDKYSEKYPSKELIEWRKDGGNRRTFVGCLSELRKSIKLMFEVFGWE